MRDELDIQTLQRAKANAVAYYHAKDTDQDFWEQCVQDIDDEIKDIGRQEVPEPMFSNARLGVMAVIVLILLTVWLSGCEAAQGIGKDITWFGAAGQKMLEDGHELQEK